MSVQCTDCYTALRKYLAVVLASYFRTNSKLQHRFRSANSDADSTLQSQSIYLVFVQPQHA